MPKNILITGGAGYVGFSLSRKLAEAHRVCVIDNFSNSRVTPEQLADIGITVERLDIRDRQALGKVIDTFGPDCIVHLAAVHFIPACENDPPLCFSTNIEGTMNLASLCPAACRFVSISSGAVYGPSALAHHEESSEIRPDDFYGISKLHGEHYVHYFAKKHGFAAVIVRLFNVVGPGETNPHIVPEIFAQILAGRRTMHLGNIEPKRDFIHVEDAADALSVVGLHGDVQPGVVETVNLGTGEQHSVSDVIDMISLAKGVDLKIEADPSRFRKSDRPVMSADIAKIDSLFGWSPRRTLNDAIEDMARDPEMPREWIQKYAP